MFLYLLCSVLCRVLFFVAFRSFVAFCSDTLYSVLFCSVTFCRVISCFLFNKMDCTYTLLYIIDKGGRKNLREDVSDVLRDEALSAFENIVIGFHEYKSTTLTPYNREKHHFLSIFSLKIKKVRKKFRKSLEETKKCFTFAHAIQNNASIAQLVRAPDC